MASSCPGVMFSISSAIILEMKLVLADVEKGPLDEVAARFQAEGVEVLASLTDVSAVVAWRNVVPDPNDEHGRLAPG